MPKHTKIAGFVFLCLAILAAPAGVLCAEGENQTDTLPIRVRLLLTKVNPMLQDENYQKAAEILEAFKAKGADSDARQDYHHPEIFFTLGNCYLMLKKHEQAAAAYRSAVRRAPEHTGAWLNLGRTAYELNRLSEAGRCFFRAYETANKKEPEHLYHSALSYLMAEENGRSLELFERLLNRHSQAIKPEWKESLVHALLAADKPRRALAYIRELADFYTGKKKRQWQEILLHQYIQLEMKDAALKLARSLTREAPEIEKWWKALANIHLNEGRYEKALTSLLTYSYLTPLKEREKKLIADLSFELGIPVKAAPIYEACLKNDPDKNLLRRLALAYRKLGQPEKALEQIKAFESHSGNTERDADLMLLSAELYYALEQYEKAAESYRQAAQKKGAHSGRAWLMAGYAAWQTDDFKAAGNAFERAVRYKEQEAAAQRALEKIKNMIQNQ
ncbi:MAG: tetratricopeptide repeat protein [Desulfosalsimonadaceae bacterium]